MYTMYIYYYRKNKYENIFLNLKKYDMNFRGKNNNNNNTIL